MKEEKDVSAAQKQLVALEQLAWSLSVNGPDLNFAMESEISLGHNKLLHSHFSNKTVSARNAEALESITEAIGNAFKNFIARLIAALKKTADWLADKALSAKSALKEKVLSAYEALPTVSYRITWTVTKDVNSTEVVEVKERWEDRVEAWKIDLLNDGKCMKEVRDCVQRFKTEGFLPKFKKQFMEVQQWEEKAFDEAIDLDIALVKQPADKAKEARQEFKDKVADQLDGDSEDIEGFATYVSDITKDIKECWNAADDSANTSLVTMNFNETTVVAAMRNINLQEFSHMRKDQASTLNSVISKLEHVTTETASGEHAAQHCAQAVRSAYATRLTWLMRSSNAIGDVFETISNAFIAFLDVELAYIRFSMERMKLEMGNGETQADWKESFDAFKAREEGLVSVIKMI